jgi:hypothetical protein
MAVIMLAASILLSIAVAQVASPLPERFGPFLRTEVGVARVAPAERALYAEYGFTAAWLGKYAGGRARRMTVEAYRFDDSEGAHAAYLSSRPAGGVSPMIWQIDAVTHHGMTVMRFRNYMLRFRGALPSISSTMGEMLTALPGLADDIVPSELNGRYLDALSTRAILGPVSLERFARRIPPSAAEFRLGARGRLGRFETPAGAMTEVTFEYPTEEIARDRTEALRALPGLSVRVDGTCVGLILDPMDAVVAEELLQDACSGGSSLVGWDPYVWDGPLTLSGGLNGVVFAGLGAGAPVALMWRSQKRAEPFPNRLIFLRL